MKYNSEAQKYSDSHKMNLGDRLEWFLFGLHIIDIRNGGKVYFLRKNCRCEYHRGNVSLKNYLLRHLKHLLK